MGFIDTNELSVREPRPARALTDCRAIVADSSVRLSVGGIDISD
jgi:hypothetical protein